MTIPKKFNTKKLIFLFDLFAFLIGPTFLVASFTFNDIFFVFIGFYPKDKYFGNAFNQQLSLFKTLIQLFMLFTHAVFLVHRNERRDGTFKITAEKRQQFAEDHGTTQFDSSVRVIQNCLHKWWIGRTRIACLCDEFSGCSIYIASHILCIYQILVLDSPAINWPQCSLEEMEQYA